MDVLGRLSLHGEASLHSQLVGELARVLALRGDRIRWTLAGTSNPWGRRYSVLVLAFDAPTFGVDSDGNRLHAGLLIEVKGEKSACVSLRGAFVAPAPSVQGETFVLPFGAWSQRHYLRRAGRTSDLPEVANRLAWWVAQVPHVARSMYGILGRTLTPEELDEFLLVAGERVDSPSIYVPLVRMAMAYRRGVKRPELSGWAFILNLLRGPALRRHDVKKRFNRRLLERGKLLACLLDTMRKGGPA